MANANQKLISLENLQTYHENLQNYILGIGGGSGVYNSSFNAISTPWDSSSVNNNSYYFKAFTYSVEDGVLDIDFHVRLLVNGVGFCYPFNIQRPYGDNSRIMLIPPRIIFEDDSKKDYVTYIKAFEKRINGQSALVVSATALEINEGVSFELAANKRYRADETIFKTDELGRPPEGLRIQIIAPTGTVANTFTVEHTSNGWRGVDWDTAPTNEIGETVYFYTASVREMWLEIKTSKDHMVDEAYLSVVPKGGEISEVGLVQKPYQSYITAPTGFDSASIWSDRWANKTAVINSSSRATAPYATAGGNDCVASGEASDVGGNGNTVSGEASFSRGTGNTNDGKDSIQGGQGCYNGGYSTTQVGVDLNNDGGNAAQFGTGNKNHANHTLQTGYNNEIPTGCDYAATIGANLKANAKYQGVHGKHNATDTRALDVWGYGTADEKKNVFAIPMSGTPEEDYDGITLGYFNKIMNQTVGNIEILLKTI
jgi:hypothetical protein